MFNEKKRYYKEKLKGVERTIWDLEFKRYKTLEIREQIRTEYDGLRSKLEILQTKIAAESEKGGMKETDEGEFNRLGDQKVLLERDIERMKKQMDGLDIEVQGSQPTAELPEGHQGINQTLEALRQLEEMIKSYIKEI